MRIMVIGGLGYIGSRVARKYEEMGHEVMVVDRDMGKAASVKQTVYFDIRKEGFRGLVEGFNPEVVSFQAGDCSVRHGVEHSVAHVDNNLRAVVSLLEIVKNFDCKFIYASSGGGVCTEDGLPKSGYGICKVASEMYLDYYGREFGMRWCALRYGNVYGEDGKGVVKNFIEACREGEALVINGTGEQTRDFVYIDDVVEANVEALEREGIKMIGTGVKASRL